MARQSIAGPAPARLSRSVTRPLPMTIREGLLDEGSDWLFRQFLHDAFSVGAQLEIVRETFGAIIGLTGPQYQMLIVVAHLQDAGQVVTVNALAARLHVSGTFITAETNKLRKMGMLEKTPGEADRRSVLLSITPKARADLARLAPILLAVNNEIFREVTRGEYRVMRQVFAKLVRSLDDARLLAESLRRKEAQAPQ